MLTCEEDDGILWVQPIFAASEVECVESEIIVTLDDCDCEGCAEFRSGVHPVSTIFLRIPVKGKHVVQRLTPDEARAMGSALIRYARDIEDVVNSER